MKTEKSPEPLKPNAFDVETQYILTAADTGGAYTEAILWIKPCTAGEQHTHPFQDEYFEVLEGQLCLEISRQVIFLEPEESFIVNAGIPYTAFAPGGAAVKCRSIWRPFLWVKFLVRKYFQTASIPIGNSRIDPRPAPGATKRLPAQTSLPSALHSGHI